MPAGPVFLGPVFPGPAFVCLVFVGLVLIGSMVARSVFAGLVSRALRRGMTGRPRAYSRRPWAWMRAVTAAVDHGCRAAAASSPAVVAGRRRPRTLATNGGPPGRCSVTVSASRSPGSGSDIR